MQKHTDWVIKIQAADDQVQSWARSMPASTWLAPVEGAWSAKDLLGHLVAWSDFLLDQIQALLAGQAETIPAVDVDAWNAAQIRLRQDWPAEQLLLAWKKSAARAVQLAASLPVDAAKQSWRVAWAGEPIAIDNLFELWLVHIEQHRVTLTQRGDKTWVSVSTII